MEKVCDQITLITHNPSFFCFQPLIQFIPMWCLPQSISMCICHAAAHHFDCLPTERSAKATWNPKNLAISPLMRAPCAANCTICWAYTWGKSQKFLAFGSINALKRNAPILCGWLALCAQRQTSGFGHRQSMLGCPTTTKNASRSSITWAGKDHTKLEGSQTVSVCQT